MTSREYIPDDKRPKLSDGGAEPRESPLSSKAGSPELDLTKLSNVVSTDSGGEFRSSCVWLVSDVCAKFGLVARELYPKDTVWGGHLRAVVVGESGERYFLKEKPFYLSSQEWQAHHLIQGHLAKLGIVPGLLQSADGGWFQETPDGRYFELQQCVPGAQLQPEDLVQLSSFGTTVAQFHVTGERLAHLGSWDSPGARSTYFPVQRSSLQVLQTNYTDRLAKFGINTQDIRQIFASIDHSHQVVAWKELKEGIIHGDCHHRNAIKLRDGGCILIDLDDCRLSYLLEDLAWSLVISCAFDWTADSTFPKVRDNFDSARAIAIVEGYEAIRPISQAERKALSHFLAVALVTGFSNCMGFDCAQSTPADNIGPMFEQLKKLMADVPRITFILTEGA